MTQTEWTAENFAGSVTARCFTWKGMDNDPWKEVCEDDEVRRIFELEQSIGSIPDWAQKTLEMNGFPWWCPHYLFPQPVLDIVDAIGSECAPTAIHGCYMVARERKERMCDYVFCLDAWLAGVPPEVAARELSFRKRKDCDWQTVCNNLWRVLGEHSEIKDLFVERILHRQRWWLKATIWDDDARDKYCCDQYLGDIVHQTEADGKVELSDPFHGELESPRVKKMDLKLSNLAPDWESTHLGAWAAIRDSQLCAPKAFRFMERMLWLIGKGKPITFPSTPIKMDEEIPDFLLCADTYPDQDELRQQAVDLLRALRSVGEPHDGEVGLAADIHRRLGTITPVKTYLCKLIACRLSKYAAPFTDTWGTRSHGKTGSKPLDANTNKEK